MKKSVNYLTTLITVLFSYNSYSTSLISGNSSGDLTFSTTVPELCGFKLGGTTTLTSDQIKFKGGPVVDGSKKNLILIPYSNKTNSTLKYQLKVKATSLKQSVTDSPVALAKIKLLDDKGAEITQNSDITVNNNDEIKFSASVNENVGDIAAGDHTITAVATLTCS